MAKKRQRSNGDDTRKSARAAQAKQLGRQENGGDRPASESPIQPIASENGANEWEKTKQVRTFRGTVNLDVRDSTPDWTPYVEPKAPKNAPNVLFVVWDDTGFGTWDCYGGLVEMIEQVTVNVSGEAFRDLEREIAAAFARD